MRIRPERVAETIKREMAEIIMHKLRDPRLGGMISVTDVEVTRDLTMARIYVSVLGTDAERAKAIEALTHSVGFVRHELAPRLGLREMPEIRFLPDNSIQQGARVEE
ncbi:MAG TPA: 30S ribosome-binding factor RbfA, partial [Candidatus Eisenbacteria bacterium]|nr:30S ribosome-binding factor RbfA [Candidatus Eisenbacteria bacterium]